MAPADKRFYAVRDVTATVDSLPLITASILSKKLAANVDALVMDVKVGSGAFLPRLADAEALARTLVDTANGAGLRTRALITDMNQVAEGVKSAPVVMELSAQYGVDMPISEQVARVVAGEIGAAEAYTELLARPRGFEGEVIT